MKASDHLAAALEITSQLETTDTEHLYGDNFYQKLSEISEALTNLSVHAKRIETLPY